MFELSLDGPGFAYWLSVIRKLPQNRSCAILASAAAGVGGADLKTFLATVAPELQVPTDKELEEVFVSIKRHSDVGVAMLAFASAQYPKQLTKIVDAPPILYVKGDLGLLTPEKNLAVVGTRDASLAGLEIARRMSKFFAMDEWAIVSGLALGIDAAAHRGALEANGKTIAVLAHGLHTATPKTNEKLAYEILERGGLWVSEHPVGRVPRAEQFKLRNRIQTGLSVGSIIVEGKQRSGSMAQAKFCLDQSRLLFAVVPETSQNLLGLVCEGTAQLVATGQALPVRNRHDYQGVLKRIASAHKALST